MFSGCKLGVNARLRNINLFSSHSSYRKASCKPRNKHSSAFALDKVSPLRPPSIILLDMSISYNLEFNFDISPKYTPQENIV